MKLRHPRTGGIYTARDDGSVEVEDRDGRRGVFQPDGTWLKDVELEGSVDYVATGLLRAGDVIGNERFLDDASPWSFSLVFVLPIAPLP